MQFFGYFGGNAGKGTASEQLSYGRAVGADTPPLIPSDSHGCLQAAWGPQVASADGVSVVLRGDPLMRPSSGQRWTRTEHPAQWILTAYREHGDACISQLDGRFAFAILDARKQRAIVAVDPMGIERAALTVSRGQLVFGESAEAVAGFPGRDARINLDAVFDYLVLHMVPSPGTAFQGVRKLRPGHLAMFERGTLTERLYCVRRFNESDRTGHFDALQQELLDDLRTAVRDCEPTGCSGAFLSGGLDSSSVVGIMSQVAPRPTRTFTIGFGYPDYDETAYSRAANAHFGCEGNEYVVTGEDIADGFPLIARAYDEPFGNSSALPVYYCARYAKSLGIGHLLAGDGGDELFAGNSRYAEQQVFERYQRVPALFRQGLLEPALAAWPDALSFWLVRKGRGYVKKANIPLPARLETSNLLLRQGTAEVLHPDFRAAVDESGTFRQMQELWDSAPAETCLNRMLYYDWQYTLADNDLRKVETMSRLAGVRVSYPMLHPDVVELSMRIPPRVKMPGMKLRDFYKRATTGFLPDEIIHKKKHGFGLPFGLWLKETPRLQQQIDCNLMDFRSRNIMQSQFIDRLLHLHGQDDARYYGVFIWVIAMLEQWFKEHNISP